jgi:sugar lactone lactonase YvrE
VSTASFVRLFSVSAQDTAPTGLFFKDDGTVMYVTGNATEALYAYNLSTAWNISTAVWDAPTQNYFNVTSQETLPTGIFFKSDGLKMYIVGTNGIEVNEYSLSTAWQVSSASFVRLFSVAAQESTPQGLFFKSDGTQMYIIGDDVDSVWAYDLSTAWNITATWDAPTQNYKSISAQEINPQDVFLRPDGLKMFVMGSTGDDVNEYDLSTAWDITTASFLRLFSISAQETTPTGLFFSPDGLKMYVIGFTGRDVNEYTLSTAWNISTASFIQLFSVATQETNPSGVFFKSDGLKMYVVGSTSDSVHEYTLSTAWNVSTASFLQSFSVSAQETNPNGLTFKPDGTKMYIVGSGGVEVNEYSLSTPWDISTTSFLRLFSVRGETQVPVGIVFKPDGLKMYTIDQTSDAVWAYNL